MPLGQQFELDGVLAPTTGSSASSRGIEEDMRATGHPSD